MTLPKALQAAFFILFIIASSRLTIAAANINQSAIQTVAHCLSLTEIEDGDHAVTLPRAYLAGIRAYCRGDNDSANAAWQVHLTYSSERLRLLRAAAPHDPQMASFTVSQHPDQAEAHFWWADALMLRSDRPAAIDALRQGLSLAPDRAEEWVILGTLYEAEGKWQAAAQAYDQGCFLFDRGGNGCVRAGRIYLDHGLYELAVDRYQTSLEQIPTFYPRAHEGLATAFLALDRTDEAIFHLTLLAERGSAAARQQLEQLRESNN